MCMLFIKPENLTLPMVYFNSLKSHNADGVSVYNLSNGQLFKTMSYEKALEHLNALHDDELVVHFRFGTSGKSTEKQLHGWGIVNNEYSFFHNGVMSTFNGDKAKGLSDTQQFVNYVNSKKLSINEVVNYLELFEKGSRFLIVKKSDNSIITPNCAKWNDEIYIENAPIKFSNSYAIDFHLLQDDGHKKPKSNWSRNDIYNMWDDDVDYSSFNDDGVLTSFELSLIVELDELIKFSNKAAVKAFIIDYPEIAAIYMIGDY